MRVMVIVKADEDSEAGVMPSTELLAAMGAYNEELVKAGVMLAGEGLKASSHYTDELSAHLLCAAANAVYLEKHAFALDRYLEEPQRVVKGRVRPTETPGTGMCFAEGALAPYRIL